MRVDEPMYGSGFAESRGAKALGSLGPRVMRRIRRWLSDKRTRSSVLILAISITLAAPGHAQIELPDMGNSSSWVLSSARDRELGEAFIRAVRAKLDVSDDPMVRNYIEQLGARLGAHAGSGVDLKFFVVMADELNAFAGPGGYIGIHSGLITTTETESELASVVAHEIAHVTQRHLARAFEQAEGLSIPVLAGLIAAVLIGTQSPEAGQAAAAAVFGANLQNQLNFSRANELEADRLGMRVLADSGFEVGAMPRFFERMQEAARYYRKPPEWLSTHPLTTSRISDSLARAEQYGEQPAVPSTLSYHLVRAKLALAENVSAGQSITDFRDRISRTDGDERTGAQYGLALALIANGEHARAEAQLRDLVSQHPSHPSLLDALAQAVSGTGRTNEALEIYSRGLTRDPGSSELALGQVRLLLDRQRPEAALETLTAFARLGDKSQAMLRLEAQAYEQLQRHVDARIALSEFYYLDGDLDSAINQLKRAQESGASDFYTSARVDARLRELEQEFAERARADN